MNPSVTINTLGGETLQMTWPQVVTASFLSALGDRKQELQQIQSHQPLSSEDSKPCGVGLEAEVVLTRGVSCEDLSMWLEDDNQSVISTDGSSWANGGNIGVRVIVLTPHLGEEKVKPLSVPASYGKSSSRTSSFQRSPSHRSKLSTPTNQSGLGTRCTINDSCGSRGGSGPRGGRYSVGGEKKEKERTLDALTQTKETSCYETYVRVLGEDLKLSVGLAGASHNSGRGEDPINTLDAFAGRFHFLQERPGLAFLRKLPHSVAGKAITLPHVIVGAVGHTWKQRERERMSQQV
ncbi:hypothetical protein EYF80_013830 [Liparis tanakae]|uniref:Uncharacterized protein n=1 Tax=Liparis tanakae TaxID=230148 RepID=A0A4Z2ID31_9TELE|nr:hypothetical protein EYF80_013830 [Liparis tanakae]